MSEEIKELEPTDEQSCFNCNWLRFKSKLGQARYFCRNKGSIMDPKKRLCECWELENNNDGEATYADYKGASQA